jgi:hypothetical protein
MGIRGWRHLASSHRIAGSDNSSPLSAPRNGNLSDFLRNFPTFSNILVSSLIWDVSRAENGGIGTGIDGQDGLGTPGVSESVGRGQGVWKGSGGPEIRA